MAEEKQAVQFQPFTVNAREDGTLETNYQQNGDMLLAGMGGAYNSAFMRFGQDPRALRPWVDATRQQATFAANMAAAGAGNGLPLANSYISLGDPGKEYNVRTNAGILLKDEWSMYDNVVLQVALAELTGVNDLIAAGCVLNVPNALGTTVLEYEKQSYIGDVAMDMSATTRTRGDTPVYSMEYLPLPIIHADFSLSIRELMASRKRGTPLDTTNITMRTRKIAEYVESLLFNGISGNFQQAGGYIYGYCTHPKRVQYTTLADWGSSGITGAEVLNDVLNMIQELYDLNYRGPFDLYIPSAYETSLENDFKANSDRTIRERLMAIQDIRSIKVATQLADDNVVLVKMVPETVRMVIGFQPMVVEWNSLGGMQFEYKVMCIMVPQIRADYNDQIGLVHGSTS